MVKKSADTGPGKAPTLKNVLLTVITEENFFPTNAALDVANLHKDGKIAWHLVKTWSMSCIYKMVRWHDI